MNFGFIRTVECVNVAPPPDTRCQDPSFALANPDLCASKSELIIKPSVSLVCALGSTQFGAFLVTNGVEVDVTDEAIFSTSNAAIVTIGAGSGNATGVSQGRATIGASYSTYTASAEMNVMGSTEDCCSQQQVAMMVLIDTSRSMSQAFGGLYNTRLDYAKAAATQFVSEVNTTKDLVGLMTFNNSAATVLSSPTDDIDAVGDLVATISQTQEKTEFYDALELAAYELDATGADVKVIVILSDGEDTSDGAGNNYIGTDNPISYASNFRSAGGIIMCLGTRASGAGFALLSEFSTGGFFANGYWGTESDGINYLSAIKGYICAGNCTPAGDTIQGTPQLNYTDFINWDVSDGTVDLIGPGLFDFLPGNGLYVDLAGSTTPSYGKLTSKTAIAVTAGNTYRLSLQLAGNQRVDISPFEVTAKVFYLTGTTEVPLLTKVITINDYVQGFTPYSFSFVSPATTDVYISIQQTDYPEGPNLPALTEYFGILLGIVQFDDVTLNKNILLDNFDTENLQYIPPACGLATTWYNGGYAYGYNCYGTGCLDEPIPIQKPDPNPLPNIESGTTPPKTWTKTMTACAECPAGQTNAPADNLIPVMTGYTSPSGSVSSSYGPIVGYEPWKAFDQDDETMWISPIEIGDLSYLSYTFPEAQTVAEYALTILRYENGNLPRDWVFEGSTDGATWTTLDTRSDELWLDLSGDPERRLFNVASPISCRYYRIRFTDVELPGIGSTIDTAYIAVVALEMFGGTTPQKVCKEATATSNVSSYAAEKAAYDAAYALALAELDCGEVFTATEEVTLKCPAGTCGPDVTRSATAISYVSEEDAIKQAQKAATAAAQAVIDADCAESNNTHYATIPDMGAITPFPLVKNVEDMTGTITKVTVSILGLSHTWPSDIELFLSHRDPDGTVTSVGLMKGCGNSTAITDVDIVFDDTGVALSTNTGTPAPEDEIIDGTTYMPTEGGVAGTWAFGGAVTPVTPTVPTSFSLADFIGQDPNGQWSLWGCDDALGNSGSIARGFDVTITTTTS